MASRKIDGVAGTAPAARRALPLDKVYGLLEPGPVLLLTTADSGEKPPRPNVMTLSWHMMVEFDPPLVACVVSANDYSFHLLRQSRECALNIPTAELAPAVVGCGNTRGGPRVNKFSRFGLTPVPATRVKAPLVAECYANLECRVRDDRLVADYNLFILEVEAAWVTPGRRIPRTLHHRGWGEFMVAGKTLRQPSGMR